MDKSSSDLVDIALGWLQTSVLRIIVTRVIPLIMASGIVTLVLAWAQDWLGLDLPPAVVASYIATVMAGVIGVAFAYVKNHGGAAVLGKMLLELEALYQAGENETKRVEQGQEPASSALGMQDRP